jgi:hypothetical protein
MKRLTLSRTFATLGVCFVIGTAGIIYLNSCGKSDPDVVIDVSYLDTAGATLNGFISGYTPPIKSKLVVPDYITIIRNYAFEDQRNIVKLDLENVISIGSYAFSGCTGFTGALNIPNSVTYISVYAFSNCSGITSISASYATLLSNFFSGTSFADMASSGTVTNAGSVSSADLLAFLKTSGLPGG